jgi:hypothetical protein
MIKEQNFLLEDAHCMVVVLTDHFGHKHTVIHPTHVGVDADPKKPFPLGPAKLVRYDAEPELENIRQHHAEREREFLLACIDHPKYASHPLVLSHPEHPRNKRESK